MSKRLIFEIEHKRNLKIALKQNYLTIARWIIKMIVYKITIKAQAIEKHFELSLSRIVVKFPLINLHIRLSLLTSLKSKDFHCGFKFNRKLKQISVCERICLHFHQIEVDIASYSNVQNKSILCKKYIIK